MLFESIWFIQICMPTWNITSATLIRHKLLVACATQFNALEWFWRHHSTPLNGSWRHRVQHLWMFVGGVIQLSKVCCVGAVPGAQPYCWTIIDELLLIWYTVHLPRPLHTPPPCSTYAYHTPTHLSPPPYTDANNTAYVYLCINRLMYDICTCVINYILGDLHIYEKFNK